MRPALRAHLFGMACALLGAPATVGAALAMNRLGASKAPEARAREVAFEVVTPPKPPRPKEEPPEKRPPPRRTSRAPSPPAPALAAELPGVDLDLAAFQPERLAAVDERVLGDLDDVVHTESTVDRRPVARSTSPIDVPAGARARNLSGRVVLSLLIGADGAVKRVKVIEAEPPGVFEEAAIRSVSTWTFEPATYRDRPVEVWATLPVEFAP